MGNITALLFIENKAAIEISDRNKPMWSEVLWTTRSPVMHPASRAEAASQSAYIYWLMV